MVKSKKKSSRARVDQPVNRRNESSTAGVSSQNQYNSPSCFNRIDSATASVPGAPLPLVVMEMMIEMINDDCC
jgi:hypothetical protein